MRKRVCPAGRRNKTTGWYPVLLYTPSCSRAKRNQWKYQGGLLREYIPKIADIDSYTDSEVAKSVMELN
ncbi:MAG: hypothetical protein JJE21_07965, partial [Spirochaetaceae bacterium]|nr:hypothetical protein [Spirochaetaceae bacterium]